jgi:hypothetical protein
MTLTNKRPILYFLLFICTFCFAQNKIIDSLTILKPTGSYSVGTMIYEWTDESRILNLTNQKNDKRTIIAQIWYPAEIDKNSIKAKYSALSNDYRHVISNSYLRPSFNSSITNSNVILISPGRGTERYLYTSLTEELASNGFIVVSIDMPEIGYTIYKDGFVVKPSKEYKTPQGMMGGPYEKVDAFFEKPTEIGYQDLLFTLAKLNELNQNDVNQRFKSKMNLQEIGIFGHSLGGRIAGKFAHQVNAVKAYISMEGIPPREVRYEGLLNIPVVMLCSSGTWPYAKENYFSLINNRKNSVYMIELPEFGHNSVTDNPYIYPESFNYSINASLGLEITRKIVLSYFNETLKKNTSFSNILIDIKQIKVSKYD